MGFRTVRGVQYVMLLITRSITNTEGTLTAEASIIVVDGED